MIEIKSVSKKDVGLHLNKLPQNMTIGMLFMGDRYSCCNKWFVIEKEKEMLGICSFASNGEQSCGVPTIVGFYIVKQHRNKGYGKMLFNYAIKLLKEKGYEKIRIEVFSSEMLKIVNNNEEKEIIDLVDLSSLFPMSTFE